MSTALTELTDALGVYVLRLPANQGPMTVLDEPLIQLIETNVKSVPPGATGLILASASERVFIAGADLKSIQALDGPSLDRYLAFGQHVFGLLCKLPCPTVAAINGAALGGGLELAMHCDGLVAAMPAAGGQGGRPYPVGLPEAGLSICPGWGGTNLLPARMEAGEAILRTCQGKPLTVLEAAAAGLFDATAKSAAELIATCVGWLRSPTARGAVTTRHDGRPLRWIGRPGRDATVRAALASGRAGLPSTDAAAACVKAIDAGLAASGSWEAALKVERDELNRLRNEPAGKAAIAAFFEKSKK